MIVLRFSHSIVFDLTITKRIGTVAYAHDIFTVETSTYVTIKVALSIVLLRRCCLREHGFHEAVCLPGVVSTSQKSKT